MTAAVVRPAGPAEGPAPTTRLELDASVRALGDGRVLLGGQPVRLLRLTRAGADLVAAWTGGAPVGADRGARALAARLVAAGLAHPRPAAGPWGREDVAVVVPARDRPDALAACLAWLGPAGDVVVVDDGSRDPATLAAVAAEGGARVVRRPVSGGPAAARNTGLRATSAPLVAFVDSDTLPVGDWLEPLLRHFADPSVGAVAPRIRVPAGGGAVAAYEAVRSPLDLGTAPGVVAPGHRISFVPSATLVVRREAVGEAGFDEAMRFGEDVDLVWRLGAAGWSVRYEPAAEVEHPHRSGPRAWLAQRVAYGSSAGALAQRHPGRLHHVVVPTWAIAPWVLGLAGRPGWALAAAATGTALVVARLPALPGVRREVALMAAGAHGRVARQAFDACWRAYPPLLAAALATRRGRRLVAGGLAVSVALDWRERRPALDPVRYGALRVADDLAYATGVWLGCIRARQAGPLLPALARGPKLGRRGGR